MTDQNSTNVFSTIGVMPTEGNRDAAHSAEVAKFATQAVESKAAVAAEKIAECESAAQETLSTVSARMAALNQGQTFDLMDVIKGYHPEKVSEAATRVESLMKIALSEAAAAKFGTMPEPIVRLFINSAATKETGEAKLAVASILDEATGVAHQIKEDDNVRAEEVQKKAVELLEKWEGNAHILEITFRLLFTRTLNRVSGYQGRLLTVCEDLAKKAVLLDHVIASLYARQQMVKDDLLENCVNGLALKGQIEKAYVVLAGLEKDRDEAIGAAKGPKAELVKRQESLIQVMTKRLVDIQGFVVKEIGLYSVLGTMASSVNIISADVEFTRSNLIAALGLQLGMIVDIITTLRVARSARNVRVAEADAAVAVGTAVEGLSAAANEALLEVETSMRSLDATMSAAIKGVKNVHDNMEKVQAMQRSTTDHVAQQLTTFGNA